MLEGLQNCFSEFSKKPAHALKGKSSAFNGFAAKSLYELLQMVLFRNEEPLQELTRFLPRRGSFGRVFFPHLTGCLILVSDSWAAGREWTLANNRRETAIRHQVGGMGKG